MSDLSFASLKTSFLPAELSVLLVYDQDEPVCGVERIFDSNGIKLLRVRTCFEARAALCESTATRVVVTDLALPDGNWTDVLCAANGANGRIPVIVASRFPDTRLYLDVLDGGAHDFIVPPFSASDLAYILRTALLTDRSFALKTLGRSGASPCQEKFPISKDSTVKVVDPMPAQIRRSLYERRDSRPSRHRYEASVIPA